MCKSRFHHSERNSQCVLIVIQVARVFYYLSAAALQYLAPTILLLFSVLTLRTLGRLTIHRAKFRYKALLHWVVFPATWRANFCDAGQCAKTCLA